MKEKKILAPIRERVMFFVGREETSPASLKTQ
jgi:hypothetical protein